jgi:hypothetical protein
VGLLPLEAWVVVGEWFMSPLDLPPLALALANCCGWRLDLGGFGVWILLVWIFFFIFGSRRCGVSGLFPVREKLIVVYAMQSLFG